MLKPAPDEESDVTRLLNELRANNPAIEATLFPLIYHELRQLAHSKLSRERPDHTLQTTALVHEAFLKLSLGRENHWVSRAHFFAVASEAMKQILVDYARRRMAAKRSGVKVELTDSLAVSDQALERVLAVNEALERLSAIDPRQAKVVVLRFFGGLDYAEIGDALEVSERTVKRDWKHAQAWLYATLGGEKL